jgi:hypothetical protein
MVKPPSGQSGLGHFVKELELARLQRIDWGRPDIFSC